MQIAPRARIDDGLLDVIVVGDLGRLEFLRSFPRVLRGTHLSHPAVHAWRGREVRVVSEGEAVPVLVDGDVRARTPLSVRVEPGCARLLLPEGWDREPISPGRLADQAACGRR